MKNLDLSLDREGYLKNISDWSNEVAEQLAGQSGITLNNNHWQLIMLVREFYRETGISPTMRPLVKLVRQRIDPELGTSIALMKLFPGNPAKLIAKISGLPRPTNCL